MNLTSKRMLQFLTVCAGACALTASAQTRWIDDNFEAEGTGYTNAQINQLAGTYKMAVWGSQNENTNLLWFASPEDASMIASNLVPYTGRSPMQGSTTDQCLALNTEGQTLTRAVVVDGATGSVSLATGPKYLDTLIKFTSSEDDPEITDPLIKLALFVNVNSNLVLRHQYYDGGFKTTNSVFSALGEINPETWYRLTIKMQYSAEDLNNRCELWLNGTQLTHYNGEIDAEHLHNGPVFWALHSNASLSQISFQGTGSVDELVLASEVDLTPLTGLLLTLAFNDDLLNVFVASAAVTNGEQIASGSEVTMYTIDWYQLNSITGTGITTNLVSGAIGGNLSTNAVVEITADEAGRTATINAGQYTGTIPTGMGGAYATVPADKLSAWAVSSGLSIAQVIAGGSDYLDNYLLNVDETTTATLKITSIVYDAGTEIATITVGATDDSETDAVDFTSINGELVVWTSDNLADWSEPVSYPFTIQSTTPTSVEIDVPKLAGKFIKARVE